MAELLREAVKAAHQCSYQRSARTLAVNRMLDGMKTVFSHNLIPCYCHSVVLLFDSYIQIDADAYLFSGLTATQSACLLTQSWLQLQYVKKNFFGMNLLPMLNLTFHSESTYWHSQFIPEINTYNFFFGRSYIWKWKAFWSDNEAMSADLLSHWSLSLVLQW